jgi:hypothetical protein
VFHTRLAPAAAANSVRKRNTPEKPHDVSVQRIDGPLPPANARPISRHARQAIFLEQRLHLLVAGR